MNKTIPMVLVLGAILTGGPTYGGGADGAGGDTSHEVDTMWFTDDLNGPVTYCFDVAPDFGVSEDDAEATFRAALQSWLDYTSERSNFMGQRSFSKSTKCNGREALTFYLGGKHAKVTDAKKSFIAPVAFAVRDVDKFGANAKGFIWVAGAGEKLDYHSKAPDWTQPDLLQAILTHELGHVFGCTHLRGTIMDGELPSRVVNFPSPFDKKAPSTSIDQTKELITKGMGRSDYQGNISYGSSFHRLDAVTFERFTGVAPRGTISASLSFTRFSGRAPQFKLSLRDFSGEYEVPITWESYGAVFELGNEIFRGVRTTERMVDETITEAGKAPRTIKRPVHDAHWVKEHSIGFSANLRIIQKDGKSVAATFSLNSSGAFPVSIEYTAKEGRLPLFSVSPH